MNLIKETKGKLLYNQVALIDLQECVEQPISKSAIHYIKEQLCKTEERIQYYTEILEILEKVNEYEKEIPTCLLVGELITREGVAYSKGNTSIAITVKNIVKESEK